MHKEWFVSISLDEINRCVSQLVRVIITRLGGQRFFIGRRERMIIGADPTCNGFVKSVGFGIFTEVSLPVVCGGVAMLMQCLCQSLFLIGQRRQLFTMVQFFVVSLRTSSQPLRQVRTSWIFSRQNARPTWRADMTCRVCIFKQNALFCERIDERRLIKLTAVARNVSLSEIVNKKEDNV